MPIRQYKDMFTHALQRGVQMQKSKYDDGDWNMRRRFAEQTKWLWEESKQKEDTDPISSGVLFLGPASIGLVRLKKNSRI